MRWIRQPRLWGVFVVWAGFAGLIGWSLWSDIRSGTAGVERLMLAQSRSIADLVVESGQNGFEVYRRWEDEIAARLLDNARWIARRDSIRPLTSPELARLADEHGLGRVNLFDARGEKVASSRIEAEESLTPRHAPRDFFAPILRGEARELRIGFKPARFRGGSRFAVAVARPRGGVVVVNVFADSIRATLETVRPQHLFGALGAASGVRYVVLQQGDTVLAVTPPGAAPMGADPGSLGHAVDRAPVARERGVGARRDYEVARAIDIPGSGRALLRVGLDPAPLDRARHDVRSRAIARAIVLAGVTLLLAGWLLVWQRHDVLDREIVRIRTELEARERVSAREARLVAMGELAARVAHEVRNPLNTIMMVVQRLSRRPDLDPAWRTELEDVHAEGRRIEDTVQRFLDLSRPVTARGEAIDLSHVAGSAVRTAQAAFDAAGVRVALRSAPAMAWADPDLVAAILENLLRNAREASPPGGEVRVSVQADPERAEVSVEDDGPGVPESLRERVFDPFFTTRPHGTGLGLSVVSQHASAMGGEVRLESAASGGARFRVRLPRVAGG